MKPRSSFSSLFLFLYIKTVFDSEYARNLGFLIICDNVVELFFLQMVIICLIWTILSKEFDAEIHEDWWLDEQRKKHVQLKVTETAVRYISSQSTTQQFRQLYI